MKEFKVVAFWVRPKDEAGLPGAENLLEPLLRTFYQAFPEYEGCLSGFPAPRKPHGAFVYVSGSCNGLLPGASEYLQGLLERAFPQAEVRWYGRPWSDGRPHRLTSGEIG
ncbi:MULTISPECIES: hypothetical protein [unclassified Meiothermus]|uniref:hypothetical protein n=1 Tax=unclassified Meiothermus TaxID=370471 RepID=UPI000D7C8CAF|nr:MULTISPECIES: hypothetical protein [unclassified Meiothermus]PZA08565.1 hypothetical protein DNA98_00500 [Meiothermus sp. Pnk-1]RYM40818.1 hypothetical protein EWH23_01440 [Meiothermus sp. PNK-Is4]